LLPIAFLSVWGSFIKVLAESEMNCRKVLAENIHVGSFPVGKVQFLDMHPLSFDEFLDGAGKERLAELVRKHDLTQPLPFHY
jgi:predicted AAA+ superfamily ATPase